jgi:hypothetical protein
MEDGDEKVGTPQREGLVRKNQTENGKGKDWGEEKESRARKGLRENEREFGVAGV